MTPSETLKALKKAGKPIVRSHLYRLISKLGIKPCGNSRPKNYPDDTAQRILNHMGFPTVSVSLSSEISKPVRLVSLAQVKAARKTTRAK